VRKSTRTKSLLPTEPRLGREVRAEGDLIAASHVAISRPKFCPERIQELFSPGNETLPETAVAEKKKARCSGTGYFLC